jgi:hypothetical protein
MNKPCEYCGCDLPLGVDKKTRQQRSHHFATCKARPVPEVEPFAQRTWVGLTTEDMATCINEPAWDLVLRKAEQILKEKNT